LGWEHVVGTVPLLCPLVVVVVVVVKVVYFFRHLNPHLSRIAP
jgi:hypothetical protein